MMDPITLEVLVRRDFRDRPNDLPPYRGFSKANRDMLAMLMSKAGFRCGAEIGVWQGVYSQVLCQAMPGLSLICVDPWVRYVSGSVEKLSAALAEIHYRETCERLASYQVEIRRMTSMQAVVDVPTRSLDFVVLDGDHEFDSTMLDLIHWSQRVKVGGLIIAHDYEVAYRVGVIEAVNAYTRAHGIRDWHVTRDRVPYAFWVNP